MKTLLRLARVIDGLNERIGQNIFWLVLIMVLISAGNAVVRKTFNVSSNAFLEIQWYLFSAVFLLCAGYTLKHDRHVRIDIVYERFSARTRAVIDLGGSLLFLLPMALLIAWHAWPSFISALVIQETSPDPGGLIRWPVKLLLPVGFTLLALQGLAEAIKCLAFLMGHSSAPSDIPKGR
jgi:TRAP-type mannitol/chloroaromatic compound transport system permease small subunit